MSNFLQNSFCLDRICKLYTESTPSMQHLLLQFAETPHQENLDLSIVEYDNDLNLNVIKGTKIPAVTLIDQATDTFTKTTGEGTDSGRDLNSAITIVLDTSTQTRLSSEGADNGRSQLGSGKSYGPVFGVANVNKVPTGINGILPRYIFRYLPVILLRFTFRETGEDTHIFHSANIQQSKIVAAQ